MAFLWIFRPLLRLYFRRKRLFLLIVAAVIIFSITFPLPKKSLSSVQLVMSNMLPNLGSVNKPAVRSTDFYISEKEYHFEEVKDESSSLFGGAQCLLLDMDPFSKEVVKYQKDLGKLQCTGPDVTKLEGGVLSVLGTGLQEVSYQSIQISKDPKVGFVLGDRMAVVTAQIQLTSGGSDSIAHFLGKCIHPLGAQMRPGVQLVLYDICGEDRLEFTLEEDGTLRHKVSGYCIGPKAEIAQSNKPLTITDRCDDSTKFKGLENGFLQHMSSEMCIHFQSLDMAPPNDVPLVFYPDCTDNWKMRFGWASDFKKGKNKKTDINTDVADDFIQVNVQYADALPGHLHVEYHLQVSPKFSLKETKDVNLKPNMLILVLNSVSSAHFRRKMTKSYAYLKQLAGTAFFKGFSVFDDSSKSQLAAMMAGITPGDIASYNRFDELPWIHTLYKEQGYVTLFSEDMPCSAQYKDTLCSFSESPANHFALPFWAAAHQTYSRGQNTFCLGQRAIHNITLSYLRDFMTIYTKLPKLAVAMFSELSSWNSNGLSYMDEDLARFLAWLKLEGHLDHTILTIVSEHGSRNEMMRKTLQGKLEERNPYLSITIPAKAPKVLLDALPTLKENAKSLVTPYDLYSTLRRFVPTIPQHSGGFGVNLLEPIPDPAKRSCEELSIPKHWCPCLSVHKTDTSANALQKGARKVVEHVNKLISEDPKMAELCQKLEFSKIKTVTKLAPNDEVLKFKWSKDSGHCSECEPVYGVKPKSMFYVLYVDSKQGVTIRAIVNVAKDNEYIHPHVISTQTSKMNSCWATEGGKLSQKWKTCACKSSDLNSAVSS